MGVAELQAATHTTCGYASALRYWAVPYQGRYDVAISIPVPEIAVAKFVVDPVARCSRNGLSWELLPPLGALLVAIKIRRKPGPLKLSNVVHRVAVLSEAHQLKKLANPRAQPDVRHLLARVRRAAAKRGESPRKPPSRSPSSMR